MKNYCVVKRYEVTVSRAEGKSDISRFGIVDFYFPGFEAADKIIQVFLN